MKRVAVALLLLAGCNDGDATPASVDAGSLTSCPGEPPSGDDCVSGTFYTTCGSDPGEPRLACTGDQCRWFTNGCIAAGYVASDCPADNICCHDNWPFGEDDVDQGWLSLDFLRYGTAPWDATTALDVGVAIDPELTAESSALTCTGTIDPDFGQSPCTGIASVEPVQTYLGDSLKIQLQFTSVAGWYPFIEILGDVESGLTARLCAFEFTDTVPEICPNKPAPVCATGGTVTLNRLPTSEAELSGLVVGIDVDFPDGAGLSGQLVHP